MAWSHQEEITRQRACLSNQENCSERLRDDADLGLSYLSICGHICERVSVALRPAAAEARACGALRRVVGEEKGPGHDGVSSATLLAIPRTK